MGLGIGGILGGLGSVIKAGVGIYQNIKAGQIHPNYVPYQESPEAKQKLGLAQNLYNGRGAGAGAQERNIYNNQANTLSTMGRNATDSSQALALAGGVQSNTNNAFNELGIQEDKNKYSLLDNLNSAYDTMTNEHDKTYKDKLMKYQMDTQQQAQLRGAGMSNLTGAVNDAAGMFAQRDQQKQQNDFYNQYFGMAGGLGGSGHGLYDANNRYFGVK